MTEAEDDIALPLTPVDVGPLSAVCGARLMKYLPLPADPLERVFADYELDATIRRLLDIGALRH